MAAKSFKNSSKQALFLLGILVLLIASSLCYGDCHHFSGMFDQASSSAPRSAGRSLSENPPTNNKQSTMKFPEEKSGQIPTSSSSTTAGAVASKDREFGMAAHDVPSGPNPESN